MSKSGPSGGPKQTWVAPAAIKVSICAMTSTDVPLTEKARSAVSDTALSTASASPRASAAVQAAISAAPMPAALVRGDAEAVDKAVSDTALRAFAVSGTSVEVIAQIETLIAAGATHVCFGPPLGPDFDTALRLLGEQVLPYFRSQASARHVL